MSEKTGNEALQELIDGFPETVDGENEASLLAEYKENIRESLMRLEPREALEALDELSRRIPDQDSVLRAEIMLDRSQILIGEEQANAALFILKQACQMSARCKHPEGMARGSLLVAEALLQKEDREGAKKSFDLAGKVMERSVKKDHPLYEEARRIGALLGPQEEPEEENGEEPAEDEEPLSAEEIYARARRAERRELIETARNDSFGPQEEKRLVREIGRLASDGNDGDVMSLLDAVDDALPEESPYRSRILMFKARALEDSDDVEGAIERYEEALELMRAGEALQDPNYEKVVEELSELYRELKDYAADASLRSIDFDLKSEALGEDDDEALKAADVYMDALLDARDMDLLKQMVLWRAGQAGNDRILRNATETVVYDAWQKNEDDQICDVCETVYRNPDQDHRLKNKGVIGIWFAAAVHEDRIDRANELYDTYREELSGSNDQYFLWTLRELAKKCGENGDSENAVRYYSDAVKWCSARSLLKLEQMTAAEFAEYMEGHDREQEARKIREEHLDAAEAEELFGEPDGETEGEPDAGNSGETEEETTQEEEPVEDTLIPELDGEPEEEETLPEEKEETAQEEQEEIPESEEAQTPEEELPQEQPENSGLDESLDGMFTELPGGVAEEEIPVTDEQQIEALQRLAGVYEGIGDYQRATMIISDEVRLRIQVYGAGDPNTIATLSNLAEDFYLAGNVPRAVMIQNRVVAGFMQTLGERDMMTCEARDRLADMMEESGQLADAYRLRETLYLTMATNPAVNEKKLQRMKDKLIRVQKRLL
ncbi:MAG: tetratricopeptide repeat protein [Clostridia bacterium]|nr:tetratricopeptide repeat protein [Clostridia bacterium]